MESDRWGLSAQFEFATSNTTKQNLRTVLSQLNGIEVAVERLSRTMESTNIGAQISQQMSQSTRSTTRTSRAVDQMGDAFRVAQKRIEPLKREFRALQKEVRLVDFGELTDDQQFKRAKTQVNAYVQSLKRLEEQVQGNTTADREFVATLQRQEKVMQNQLKMQDLQRDASKAQARVGEFNFLKDAGEVVFNQAVLGKGKDAIAIYQGFDDTMSAVSATVGATGKELDTLRERASLLGASTRFTAQQAAEAEVALGTAGFKTNQILTAVGSTLSLASAGQLELAEATGISTNILSGFRMETQQVGHLTDVLARASADSNTNIQQLGIAMGYAAPNAKLFGASVEETSALIGVMSNAGIQADKAGTAARGAFLRLASPTRAGSAALAEFGIELTDSNGDMRDIIEILNEFNDKLQIDPTALKSLQNAGDDIEAIADVSQSKQVQSLKNVFGTTALSGVAAALGQINELNRLALADIGSSSNTDQMIQYFTQIKGLKLNEGEDIFSAVSRAAPNYQVAVGMINEANVALFKGNLKTLNKIDTQKLQKSLQVSPDENLLDAVIAQSPNADIALSRVSSAMEQLGVEFKTKTSSAKIMASIMEDNLAGSFRSLSSALEAVQIGFIEPLAPLIRGVTDALTRLALFLANLPAPVRGAISVTALLTVGLGALAVTIGTVGAALFGFQQALSVANLASTSMAASLIPLTGFFETSQDAFKGTNSLETFFVGNRTLARDFEKATTSTFQQTTFGLRTLSSQAVRTSQAFLLLARSVVLSPLGIAVGSFILLNALLEQVVPGFNLLGIVLGAIAAPVGFVFGLIKGLTLALLDFLGISTSGGFKAIAPLFTTIANAIKMAADSFVMFSNKGEEIGKSLGDAILFPFVFAGEKIVAAWEGTISAIRGVLKPFADFVQYIGQLLVSFLAESSPGPTYQIREKWGMTVEFLQNLFVKLRNSAILVNQAFIGLGDVSQEDQMVARQQIFQTTISLLIAGANQLKPIGALFSSFGELQTRLINDSIKNLDLLGFTLLTIASLPATLVPQLREEAAIFVPELARLINSGIPRAIAFGLPGAIAIAISTGVVRGFESGVAKFVDILPVLGMQITQGFYDLFDPNLKQIINDALSQGITDFIRSMPNLFPDAATFTFKFDFDKSYTQFQENLNNFLLLLRTYLKGVGSTSQEVGKIIQSALEPILSFQIFPALLPPLVPFLSVIVPAQKVLNELFASPALKGLIKFLSSSILPAALKTLGVVISSVIYVFNALVTLPILAVIQELTKGIVSIFYTAIRLLPQIPGIVARAIAGAITSVATAISVLLERIPYIGKTLSAVFLGTVKLILAAAPRYFNLLIRFFPIEQFKALIPAYFKIATDIARGILYALREGLAPLGNLILNLFNPASAFKLLGLYFRSGGFAKIVKPDMIRGFVTGFNYINPFDLLFGGGKTFNSLLRLGLQQEVASSFANLKQAEIFQFLASKELKAAAARQGRLLGRTVLVSMEAIIAEQPKFIGALLNLFRGLMLISPIVQIIGRAAITVMFWYTVLKPLNKEMLSAIANTQVFGISLSPVATTLSVMRFIVVDLGEKLFDFAKQIPGYVKAIQSAFNLIGLVVGVTTHELVGLSSILANIFKATIGNFLLLIPIGITAALDVALMALRSSLQLIRIKTEQYGDAIVALMQGHFGPLFKQITSDIAGVISFAIEQTIVRLARLVASVFTSIVHIIGATFAEIGRLIRDPIGESIRLLNLFKGEVEQIFGDITSTINVYIKQLQLDRLVGFVREFWLELGAVADVLLFIYGIITPFQFAMTGLIGVTVFLINEYKTGFQNIEAIIQALANPIEFLTNALQAMVSLLNVYIPPDLTEFIAGVAEQFVKSLPLVTAGIFAIAFIIKRDVGGAFNLVSSGILQIVGRIIQAVEAMQNLGNAAKNVATSTRSQVFFGQQAHAVRSKSTVAGVANPLAYSQDPDQQERASFLGEQRVVKLKAASKYQQGMGKLLKETEKQVLDDYRKSAKSGNVAERAKVLGGTGQRDDGFSYEIAPLLEKKRNRFGIESLELTDLGKGKAQTEAQRRLTQSDESGFQKSRADVANKSGLTTAFQQYDKVDQVPDAVLKNLAKKDGFGLQTIIADFQKAMENLHIGTFEADSLYVKMFKVPQAAMGKSPYNPDAFDLQVSKFKAKGTDDEKRVLDASTNVDSIRKDMLAKFENVSGLLGDSARQSKFKEVLEPVTRKLDNQTGSKLKGVDVLDIDGRRQKFEDIIHAETKKLAKIQPTDLEGFTKQLDDVLRRVVQIQTQEIEQLVRGFSDFTEVNLKAVEVAARSMNDLPQVATGYNVITQGVQQLATQTTGLVEEGKQAKKSLFRALFGFSGLPDIVEQFQSNRQTLRRIQEVEGRTNVLANRNAQEANFAAQLRERGLRAVMANAGFSYATQKDAFYLDKQITAKERAVLENFVKNRSRKIDVSQESAFKGDMDVILRQFQPLVTGFAINTVDDLTKFHQVIIDRLGAEEKSLFQKYIQKGSSDTPTGGQISNGDRNKIVQQINDLLSKDKIRDELGAASGAQISRTTLQRLTGIGEEQTRNILENFVRRGNFVNDINSDISNFYEEIQKKIGLGKKGVPSLSRIQDVGLKNPMAQIESMIELYVDSFEAQAKKLGLGVEGKINDLEASLSRTIIGPSLAVKIVSPIREFYKGFAAGVEKLYSDQKFKTENFVRNIGKDFQNLNLVTTLTKLKKQFQSAKDNSLEGVMALGEEKLVRDPKGTVVKAGKTYRNEGRPADRVEMQSRLLRDLQSKQNFNRVDANKTLVSVLKGAQSQDAVKQMLSRQGLSEADINSAIAKIGEKAKYTVAEILKIQGLNVDKIAKSLESAFKITDKQVQDKILNNAQFTSAMATPFQLILLKKLPKLFQDAGKDFVSIVNKTGGGAIVSVAKVVAKDIARGFKGEILTTFSNTVEKLRTNLALGLNQFARKIDDTFGRNPFSGIINKFADFIANKGSQISQFFAAQTASANSDGAKSFTGKIVSAVRGLYQAITNQVESGASAAQGQGFFSKIKNAFTSVKDAVLGLFRTPQLKGLDKQIAGEKRRLAIGQKFSSVPYSPELQERGRRQTEIAQSKLNQLLPKRELMAKFSSPKYVVGELVSKLDGVFTNVGKRFENLTSKFAQKAVNSRQKTVGVEQKSRTAPYMTDDLYQQHGMDARNGILTEIVQITPLVNKAFASVLDKAGSVTSKLGTYFQGAALRSQNAWERSANHITGKSWWSMVKRAAWTGAKILGLISEASPGPSAKTRENWDKTENSVSQNMGEMAQSAGKAGEKITESMGTATEQVTQNMKAASQKSVGFLDRIGNAVGSVGKAGFAIGAAVTGVGFAMQTASYSLSTMGIIGEETSQQLSKFFEIFTLLGAVGGIATPLFTAFAQSLGAIGAVSGAVISGITGIGSAIAGVIGFGEIAFAPMVLGIGAVAIAIAGLLFAFKTNFLGIRSIVQGIANFLGQIFAAPIGFIQNAWQKFTEAFGPKLMPIIQPALEIAQGLINALNHSPTERIPEAWEAMQARIGNVFNWLLQAGSSVGQAIGNIFAPIANLFKRSPKVVAPEQSAPPPAIATPGAEKGGFFQNIIGALMTPINAAANLIKPLQQPIAEIANFFKSLATIIKSVAYLHKVMSPLAAQGTALNATITQIAKFLYNIRSIVESIEFLYTHIFNRSALGKDGGKSAANIPKSVLGSDDEDSPGYSPPKVKPGSISEIVQMGKALGEIGGSAIQVKDAWVGFVDWFVKLPLVSQAVSWGMGLINALNHSPTEVIPIAWNAMTGLIGFALLGLVVTAAGIGFLLVKFLSNPVGYISAAWLGLKTVFYGILDVVKNVAASIGSLFNFLIDAPTKISNLAKSAGDFVGDIIHPKPKFSDEQIAKYGGVEKLARSGVSVSSLPALTVAGIHSAEGRISPEAENELPSDIRDSLKVIRSQNKQVVNYVYDALTDSGGIVVTSINAAVKENPLLVLRFATSDSLKEDLFKTGVGDESFDNLKEQIGSVLEDNYQKYNKKTDIAGWSLGTAISQRVAAEFPQYIDKIYNFNPLGVDEATDQIYNQKTAQMKQEGLSTPDITNFINSNDVASATGERFLPAKNYTFKENLQPQDYLKKTTAGFPGLFHRDAFFYDNQDLNTLPIDAPISKPERKYKTGTISTNSLSSPLYNPNFIEPRVLVENLRKNIKPIAKNYWKIKDFIGEDPGGENATGSPPLKATSRVGTKLLSGGGIDQALQSELKLPQIPAPVDIKEKNKNNEFPYENVASRKKTSLVKQVEMNQVLQPEIKSLQVPPLNAIEQIKLTWTNAIAAIAEAWNGFTSSFGLILNTLVAPASVVGTQLVNFLNHGAADVTQLAWERATGNISGSIGELPSVSEASGIEIEQFLSNSANGFLRNAEHKIDEYSTLVNSASLAIQPDSEKIANIVKDQVHLRTGFTITPGMESMFKMGYSAPDAVKSLALGSAKAPIQKLKSSLVTSDNSSIDWQVSTDSFLKNLEEPLINRIAFAIGAAYTKHRLELDSMKHLDQSGQTEIVAQIGKISSTVYELLEKLLPVLLAGANPVATGGASIIAGTGMIQALQKIVLIGASLGVSKKVFEKTTGVTPGNAAISYLAGASVGGMVDEAREPENAAFINQKIEKSGANKFLNSRSLPTIPAIKPKAPAAIVPESMPQTGAEFSLSALKAISAAASQFSTKLVPAIVSSVAQIKDAWSGFLAWFVELPLVSQAITWGIGLINALNHSPTEQIPKAWEGAVEKIKGSLGGLLDFGVQSGKNLIDSFNPFKKKKATAVSTPVKPAEVVATPKEATKEIEKISVKFASSGTLSSGIAQIGQSVGILGEDFVDFGLRATKALFTLNFGELADSIGDFGGNFGYFVSGVVSGFTQMTNGAIAFLMLSATSFAPFLLALGGVAFVAAVIVANFLGLRGILAGAAKVGVGAFQVLDTAITGVINVAKAFGKIAKGVFYALTGDASLLDAGILELKTAFTLMGKGFKVGLKNVKQGMLEVFGGLFEIVANIFPPIRILKNQLLNLAQILKVPEQAGEMLAEMLILGVKRFTRILTSIPVLILGVVDNARIAIAKLAKEFIQLGLTAIQSFTFPELDFSNITFSIVGDRLMAELKPLGKAILGIPKQLISAIESAIPALKAPFEYMRLFAKGFVNRLKKEFSPEVLQAIESGFTKASETVKPIVENIANSTKEAMRNVAVSLNLEESLDKLQSKFTETTVVLTEKWGQFAQNLTKEKILSLVPKDLNDVSRQFNATVNVLEVKWGQFTQWLKVTPVVPHLIASSEKYTRKFADFVKTLGQKWEGVREILSIPNKFAGFFEKLRTLGANWVTFVDKLEGKWSAFAKKPMFTGFFVGLINLGEGFQKFASWAENRWESLAAFLATTSFIPGFIKIVEVMGNTFANVLAFMQSKWQPFTEFLTTTNVFAKLFDKLRAFGEAIPTIFADIPGSAKKAITEFRNRFGGLFNFLKGGLFGIKNQSDSVFKRLPNPVVVAIERIQAKWEGFTEKFRNILNPIVEFSRKIAQKLISILNHSPTEKIPTAWEKAAKLIIGFIKGLLEPAQDVANLISSAFKTAFKGTTEFFSGFFTELKSGFGAISGTLEKIRRGAIAASELDEVLKIGVAFGKLKTQIKVLVGGMEQFIAGLTNVSTGSRKAATAGQLFGKAVGTALRVLLEFAVKVGPALFKVSLIFVRLGIEVAAFAAKVAWASRYVINYGIRVGVALFDVAKSIYNFFAAIPPIFQKVGATFDRFGQDIEKFKTNFIGGFGDLGRALWKLGGVILDVFSPEMKQPLKNFIFGVKDAVVSIVSFLGRVTSATKAYLKTFKGIGVAIAAAIAVINPAVLPVYLLFGEFYLVVKALKFGIANFGKVVGFLGAKFDSLLLAVAPVTKFLAKNLNFILLSLTSTFLALNPVIVILGAKIAAVKLAFDYFVPTLKLVKELFAGLFTGLLGTVKLVLKQFGRFVAGITQFATIVKSVFQPAIELVGTKLAIWGSAIATVFDPIIQKVKKLADRLGITGKVEKIVGDIQYLTAEIKDQFGKAVEFVVRGSADLTGAISYQLAKATVKFKLFFESASTKVKTFIDEVSAKFRVWILEELQSIRPILDALGEIGKAFYRIGKAIVELIADTTLFGVRIGSVVGDVLIAIGKIGGAIFDLTAKILTPVGIFGITTAVAGITFAVKDLIVNIFKLVGEAIPAFKELALAIANFLEAPIARVGDLWNRTGGKIIGMVSKIRGKTKEEGANISQDLAEVPTQKVESLWSKTGGKVVGVVSKIRGKTKEEGPKISQDLSQGSPGPTLWIQQNWQRAGKFVQSKIEEISAVAKVEGKKISNAFPNPFSGFGGKGTGKDAIKQKTEQEIEQMDKLGQSSRSVLMSLGSALSNFAPQLATPLFMLNDFVDAFFDLKTAIPVIRSVLVANGALATSSVVVADAAGSSAIVVASSAVAGSTATSTAAGVVVGANSFMASSYQFVAGVARIAYKSMIAPLIPFLPIILGIATGAFILYQAFKNNFLGISDLVVGVGNAFKEFFTLLLGGAWSAIAGIFINLENEIGNIFKTLKMMAGMILQPFQPLFTALGIQGGGGSGGALGVAMNAVVSLILLPLRLIAGTINFIVSALSNLIQTLVRVAAGIINFILLPFRIVGAVIVGISRGIESFSRNFGSALDMFLLKPMLIAIDITAMVSRTIAGVGGALVDFIFTPINQITNLLYQSLAPIIDAITFSLSTLGTIAAGVFLFLSPVAVFGGFMAVMRLVIGGVLGFVQTLWAGTLGKIVTDIQTFVFKSKGFGTELINDLATSPLATIKKAWTAALADIQAKLQNLGKAGKDSGESIANAVAGILPTTNTATPRMLPPGVSAQRKPGVTSPPEDKNLKLLGLTAAPQNLQELKSAYRQQVKIHHPDKGGDAGKFNQVNEAYNQMKLQMESPQTAAPEQPIAEMVDKTLPSRFKQLGTTVSSTFSSIGNAIANFSPQLAAPLFILSDVIDAILNFTETLPMLKAFFAGKKVATVADAAVTTTANLAIAGSEATVAVASQTSALAIVTGATESSLASTTEAGVVGGANTFMASTFLFLSNAARTAMTSIMALGTPVLLMIAAIVLVVGAFYLAFKNNFLGIADFAKSAWNVISSIFSVILAGIQSVISVVANVSKAVWSLIVLPFQLIVPIIKTIIQALGILALVVGVFVVIANIGLIIGSVMTAIAPVIAVMTTIWSVITGIASIVAFVAPILAAIFTGILATGFSALIAAIAPFIPLILGIVAAAYLIKTAFVFVFQVVVGVFNGIGEIVGGVFGTIFTEFRNIWKVLQDTGKALIEPFEPIMALFGGSGGGGFDLMALAVKSAVNVILIPFRVLGFLITNVIRGISLLIQVVVFLGGILLKVLLTPVVLIINTFKLLWSLVGGLGSLFSSLGQAVISVGQSILSMLVAPFKALWGIIQGIFNFALQGLSSLPFVGGLFKSPETAKPPQQYAVGGLVAGAGTSTGDRIPAYLSNGEFVVNAQATGQNLGFLSAINEGKIPTVLPTVNPTPTLSLPQQSQATPATVSSSPVVVENINFSFEVTLNAENGGSAGDEFMKYLEDPRFERAVRDSLRNIVERMK